MSRARDFADLAGSASAGGLTGRNLVINGAMNVAQRGTSTTSAGYLIDRFSHANSGVSVTFSQESLTSSDTPYTYGFRKYARLTNTSVSSAANAFEEFQQRFEAQDIANSGWDYTSSSSNITLSFWVRSSLAGTYYARFQTADGSQYLRYVEFTLVADTWKKVEFTTAGNSNLTVNNDNGNGLQLLITPYYGTDFTGGEEVDANDWYSRGGQADAYYPNYAQNWANTASATFDVTGVQLEVGEQATPFEHRSFGDELARCQRYFYMHCSDNTHTVGVGGYYTTALVLCSVHFPVEMRTTPSLYQVSGSNYFRIWANSTSDDFDSFTNIAGASPRSTALDANGTGASGTVGHVGRVVTNNSAARVGFNAEL